MRILIGALHAFIISIVVMMTISVWWKVVDIYWDVKDIKRDIKSIKKKLGIED